MGARTWERGRGNENMGARTWEREHGSEDVGASEQNMIIHVIAELSSLIPG